jgi:peptidoglycan/xylan/chitin deacetylase (PgdA/CDA1 family)
MVADGHQIGSHTWSHQDLSTLDATRFQNQIVYNEMAFRNILGFFPTYMRYVETVDPMRFKITNSIDLLIRHATLLVKPNY